MDTMRSGKQDRSVARGVTLLELVAVLAILGVLASIAYPSYSESVAKGRRAQATAQLVSAQQWMERFYAQNLRYDQTTDGTAVTANNQFAGRFTTVPPPGEGRAFYNLTVTNLGGPASYLITATRVGAMAGDRCGDLTLDQLGRKSFTAASFSGFANLNEARAYCWR